MSDWLYPLSASSGRYFIDDAGHEYLDTSFASFSAMMRKPSRDDWWYLATNFRKVRPGDRVWCYYGAADGDIGVVGVANVLEVDHDEQTREHSAHLAWAVNATRRLMKAPVGATEVRKHLAHPRAAVQALNPYPALVRKLVKAAGFSS